MVPVFVGFVDTKQAITLNEEHSEYAWYSFEEAIRRVPFVGQANALEQIHQQFVQREPSRWLEISLDDPWQTSGD